MATFPAYFLSCRGVHVPRGTRLFESDSCSNMSTIQFLWLLTYLGRLHSASSRSAASPPRASARAANASYASQHTSVTSRCVPVARATVNPPVDAALPLMASKPIVCLTLDGLLADNPHPKATRCIGAPRPGAAEFTRRLAKIATVVILTPRANYDTDLDRDYETQEKQALRPTRDWLDKNKIWYDHIHVGHSLPEAALYVGPGMVTTPTSPVNDDFVQAEREIRTRLVEEIAGMR